MRRGISLWGELRTLTAFARLIFAGWHSDLHAQAAPSTICHRPLEGSAAQEPEDLRSQNGELRVDLTIRKEIQPDGSSRYCYTTTDGKESPTLRVKSGDLLILNLKNDLTDGAKGAGAAEHHHGHATADQAGDPCKSGLMTATSTNLHFHGLTIPAVCHRDDVLHTSIQPDDAPFEYRLRIPKTSRPDCIGTTPIFTALAKPRISVAHQVR